MGLSLREQLLNAGLIDEKKLKEAKQAQHHQRRDQAKRPPGAPDPRAEAAKKAAAEKAARDAELNRQKEEQAAKKARKAEVKQLVAQHKLAKLAESEEMYNFQDGKRIRRLPVDKALREKLIAGSVMIVRNEGRYEFVPAEVAARIAERDTHAVVPNTKAEPAQEPAADDPYKDYVVPDDLMW